MPEILPVTDDQRDYGLNQFEQLSLAHDRRMQVETRSVRQVTNRCFLPSTWSNSYFTSMWRCWQISHVPLSAIQVAIANWYVNTTTGLETGNGAPMTLTLSVEYPRGTFTRITWNGAATGTIPDAQTGFSDMTKLPFEIPAFAWFRINGWLSCSAGLSNMNYAFACDRGRGDEFAFSGSDQTMTSVVQGSGTTSSYYPAAVLGMSDRPVWLAIGDSLTAGINETVTDPSGGRGFAGRALAKFGPHLNYGIPGDYMQFFVSSHANRVALAQRCGVTSVLNLYGSNDVFNGRTSAQMLADRASVRSYFPGISVFDNTITPRSTSTDGFKTAANQTSSTNTAANTQRLTHNAAVRAWLPGSPGYVDTALYAETAPTNEYGPIQDGGVLIPGLLQCASGVSPDGVHLGSLGYMAMEAPFNALIRSQV